MVSTNTDICFSKSLCLSRSRHLVCGTLPGGRCRPGGNTHRRRFPAAPGAGRLGWLWLWRDGQTDKGCVYLQLLVNREKSKEVLNILILGKNNSFSFLPALKLNVSHTERTKSDRQRYYPALTDLKTPYVPHNHLNPFFLHREFKCHLQQTLTILAELNFKNIMLN